MPARRRPARLSPATVPILRQLLRAASQVVLVRTLHPSDAFVEFATPKSTVTDFDWTSVYYHDGELPLDSGSSLQALRFSSKEFIATLEPAQYHVRVK